MRIIIVSDAWKPQINGVVRTIERTAVELERKGFLPLVIGPELFTTVPMPTYPEIRLAVLPYRRLCRMLDAMPRGDTRIHIATEGPLGWAARRYCMANGVPFSTAYHTKFPEYVTARLPIPADWIYALVRLFHRRSVSVMVATDTLWRTLAQHGFRNLRKWTRGVDTDLFQPRDPLPLDLPRPIALYVGRVAVEKNIETFLATPFSGSKLIVGDGPALAELQQKYPDARFVGARHGEELARYYSSADVFVFPSLTDTFGLVMLEALACGVPVAAFPVTGPLDVLGNSDVAVLGEDMGASIEAALKIDKDKCRAVAMDYSWEAATAQFIANLPPAMPLGNGEGALAGFSFEAMPQS